jgi:phasin
MKNSTPNFEISAEMRKLAQQSVERARKSVEDFIAAGRKTAAAIEGQGAAAHARTRNAADRAMEFAEHNVATSFEFAQKLIQTKDVTEIVQLQADFVKAQIATLHEQAKELGQAMA